MRESAAKHSASIPPGHDARATRADVELLSGQCLLKFQTYELLMKAILAAHRVSASIAQPNNPMTVHVDDTAGKTMGFLVRDMMGSFIMPKGGQGLSQETDVPSASSFAMTLQIVLPPDEFAKIEAEHGALVARRSFLVHHFLEDHDLHSEAGCQKAHQALLVALEHVNRAYDDLRGFALDLDDTRRRTTEIFKISEVRGSIVFGRTHWPTTIMVQSLQDAFTGMETLRCTPVDAATDWSTARYPGEAPDKDGCRSWRQVINDSGLFELQLRKADGCRHAWYRPRLLKALLPGRFG